MNIQFLSLIGWESQLLETGFLAIFLCPVWTVRQFPRKTQPPWVAIWGYRWLIFRIMLGAVRMTYIGIHLVHRNLANIYIYTPLHNQTKLCVLQCCIY